MNMSCRAYLSTVAHNMARGAADAAAHVDGRAELGAGGHARELERLVDHVHLPIFVVDSSQLISCCSWMKDEYTTHKTKIQ